MAAVLEALTDDPEARQLEALEKILAALCAQVTQLADDLRSQPSTLSRETRLQLMALEERREQALACLGGAHNEARPFRIGRLERLVEALQCSWTYFSTQRNERIPPNAPADWAVLVR